MAQDVRVTAAGICRPLRASARTTAFVPFSTYRAYASGTSTKMRSMSVRTTTKIADALGVDLSPVTACT